MLCATKQISGRQRAPMASLIWANSLMGASSTSGRSLGSMSSSRKSPWSSSVSSVTTLPASSTACRGRSVGQAKQSSQMTFTVNCRSAHGCPLGKPLPALHTSYAGADDRCPA